MIEYLRFLDLSAGVPDSSEVNALVPRSSFKIESAIQEILPLIEDVSANGEIALVKAAKKFDGFDPTPIRVSTQELEEAQKNLSAELKTALLEAIARVRKVSENNIPKGTTTELLSGGFVHQRWQPIDSVGLYVPGGKAVYPSSVIMNVVPAQVAGVRRLAIATPGQIAFNGRPHPSVLAAAALLGVDEVYNVGGPVAIAAMAYGVPSLGLEQVSMITGPGNIFVTAAKRALRGVVGIDSEAGTTEILVIADETANPEFVAADLLAQAEHDESAASVLVTNSPSLIRSVQIAIARRLGLTHHLERSRTALTGEQSAAILVSDLKQAVKFANHYATEHLSIQVDDAQHLLGEIQNAGAIFLGGYSPVSLGDYLAGSNHVLPVNQQSKFGAGLSVQTFLRGQQVIDYNQSALRKSKPMIEVLAREEGLPAHFDAISARFELD